MKTKIICKYEKEKTAKAIASSIKPENINTEKNTKIITKTEKNKVKTIINSKKSIETNLAIIDDLLSCTTTAEKMIDNKKTNKNN